MLKTMNEWNSTLLLSPLRCLNELRSGCSEMDVLANILAVASVASSSSSTYFIIIIIIFIIKKKKKKRAPKVIIIIIKGNIL